MTGINFFLIYLLFYRKALYSLSCNHVRSFFFGRVVFFMTTFCLTCFGCVPYMASGFLRTVYLYAGTQCEYIVIFVFNSYYTLKCILSDVLIFDMIVGLKCYGKSIVHLTQTMSSIL